MYSYRDYICVDNSKNVIMKDKILKVLNWIITIATAAVVFIDKLPFLN